VLHEKLITELWSITCHMGSHSVTCHMTGECNPIQPQLDRLVLDWPTLDGWKAELTLVLVMYRHGSP